MIEILLSVSILLNVVLLFLLTKRFIFKKKPGKNIYMVRPNRVPYKGVDNAAIADAVWDEALANHSGSSTFGEKVSKKLLTLAKFVGLK